MATNLRRMVVLGPSGTINPGGSHDYRSESNRLFFSDTRTRWARLWADWPTLEPVSGQLDQTRLAALDAQIARAKRDGLKVMLTLYRFPTWANGTDQLTAEQLAATMPDRKTATDPQAKAKSLMFRYPDDVSPTSVFARFLTTLASRYSANNRSRPNLDAIVDFIEVGNEPNSMWWPQQAPSADPANPDGGRLRTAYQSFTERLLTALQAIAFTPGAKFTWSHHNYTDGGVTLPNIAARWGIKDPAAQRAKQAELLQRNWNRIVTTTEGVGIAMLAQYLRYTDPNYDDGLCETFESGGATRPAYATWKALPSFQ